MVRVVLIGAGLLSQWPVTSHADTVDNPGPITIIATNGYLKVGSQRFDVNPDNPPYIAGEVDSAGSVVIPTSGIAFPEGMVGQYTVRIEALGPGSGTVNPLTGDATASISVRVRVLGPLLPGTCRIEPINVNLTVGESGLLTGVPYDQTAGTATYVANDFGVPRSTGCGLFGGFVDSQLGLPSPPPNNEVLLGTVVDPILVGSEVTPMD